MVVIALLLTACGSDSGSDDLGSRVTSSGDQQAAASTTDPASSHATSNAVDEDPEPDPARPQAETTDRQSDNDTTTSLDGDTTTTSDNDTTTTDSQGDHELDDETAAATFDPVSGPPPRHEVVGFLTTDPVTAGNPASDRWLAARSVPVLDGEEFWVKFEVQNLDAAGPIIDFAIEASGGFGPDPLCAGLAPIEPASPTDPTVGGTSCVLGPFPVQPGGQTTPFTTTATGRRQPAGDGKFLLPLITKPTFSGHPISFLAIFRTSADDEPVRVAAVVGGASGQSIEVDLSALRGDLSLDCETVGDGIEHAVVAYWIVRWSPDGNEQPGGCSQVPTTDFPSLPVGDIEIAYRTG